MDIDSPPSNSYDDLPLTPAQQAGHTHLNLPHFSASYPLPFRVLTLVGLEILLWAINLHVLTSLGVDAGRALDLTEDDEGGLLDGEETSEPQILFDGDSLTGDPEPSPSRIIRLDSPSPTTTHIRRQSHSYSHPYRQKRTRKDLHGPIYLSFFVYSGWVLLGWSGFKYVSEMGGGMDGARWVLVVIAAGIAMGLGWRKGFIARAERMGLLRSFKRILSPPTQHAPFFADVILADIITSFAKVLGDLVISGSQIYNGGLEDGRVKMHGIGGWIGLGMVALPYLLRLRQCIQEYLLPHQTSTRPLFNALKYASAFPVIFLSAAQRNVVREVASIKGMSVEALEEEMSGRGGRWFGESRVFRLWLLAVLINSMFSFWWDVSNDWGLSLLQSSTWFKPPLSLVPSSRPDTRGKVFVRNFRRLVRSVGASLGIGSEGGGVEEEEFELSGHQRSPFPSPGLGGHGHGHGHERTGSHSNGSGPTHLYPSNRRTSGSQSIRPSGPFGLRSRLLFPDNFVYYLFVLLDLVLRFTWSLKLSSHLHTISEIESGVFLMEALELGRRWMWVFLRVEWEEVKRLDARAAERRSSGLEEVSESGHSGSTTTTTKTKTLAGQGVAHVHTGAQPHASALTAPHNGQINGLGLGNLEGVDRKSVVR